jgi:hypothetical protein
VLSCGEISHPEKRRYREKSIMFSLITIIIITLRERMLETSILKRLWRYVIKEKIPPYF